MADVVDASVAKAVEEIQILVSGDGARLELIESTSDKEIRFKLDLSEVGCADCLLPAQQLAMIATQSMQSHTGDPEFSVAIVDPRESA